MKTVKTFSLDQAIYLRFQMKAGKGNASQVIEDFMRGYAGFKESQAAQLAAKSNELIEKINALQVENEIILAKLKSMQKGKKAKQFQKEMQLIKGIQQSGEIARLAGKRR